MEQSMLEELMEPNRKAKPEEELLLDLLISKSTGPILPTIWKENLIVQPMNDGSMGSLKLFQLNDMRQNPKFGKQASEYQFLDADGVLIIASLYLDRDGYLYELDMWKVDNSRLLSW